MRLVVRVLAALCVLAFVAGQELAHEQRVAPVPTSRVDPAVCEYEGGLKAATEHPDDVGVYTVRCGDGVVLTGWNR
jgi:hypothetical protein